MCDIKQIGKQVKAKGFQKTRVILYSSTGYILNIVEFDLDGAFTKAGKLNARITNAIACEMFLPLSFAVEQVVDSTVGG